MESKPAKKDEVQHQFLKIKGALKGPKASGVTDEKSWELPALNFRLRPRITT